MNLRFLVRATPQPGQHQGAAVGQSSDVKFTPESKNQMKRC
jgi:hypothetical protein